MEKRKITQLAKRNLCTKEFFFKTCLQYAKTFKDHIYILSAKYGILELDEIISPYDKTLNSMSKKDKSLWVDMVKSQLKEKNISTQEEAIFLCGKNYYSDILHLFDVVQIPLDNLPGMGYQIQWMQSKLKKTRLF